jgi:hypothetical protein
LVWLATGISSLRVRRLDAWTLSLRPENGYLHHSSQRMLRDTSATFTVGYTVRLAAVTFRVEEVTTDGRPLEVSARFARSLDDPSMLLFQWGGKAYERLLPPSIGRELTLPAADLLESLSE